MVDIWQDLSVVLPEIILIIGAMISLLYGAYVKQNGSQKVLILSISTVLLSLYAVYQSFYLHLSFHAFSNMITSNSVTGYGKALILISSVVILLMMMPFMDKEQFARFETPVLLLISVAGMMFMLSSSSLMSVYLSLEMMSLPIYIMVASDPHNSKSAEASIKYFVLGSLASGIFLLGTSMVYGFTGTINFAQIYEYYINLNLDGESVAMPIGFLVGMVLILVAFSFKISAVPFHMWTPDVYEGASTLITAFLASAPKVAGFIILIRMLYDPFSELYNQWQQIIAFISVASMLVGSLGAMMQKNFKRLLAYSTIGHVGFALAGLVTVENDGVEAVLIYLTIYLTMTLAAFACLMLLKRDGKAIEAISDLSGLSVSCPNIALAITILLLSMAGIPPLAGFFIKFYILFPVIKAGLYTLAIIFVLSSVIAAFYYLKVIKVMYFDAENKKLEVWSSYNIKFVAFIGTLVNLLYALIPSPVINTVELVSMILFK